MIPADCPQRHRGAGKAYWLRFKSMTRQPLLSAGIALPLFFCAGLAFIGLGLGLFYSSNGIKELEYDYTGNPGTGDCSVCAAKGQGRAPPPGCACSWSFTLPELFPGPVYLYYELSNFYQNNRRYGVSRDDAQLSGLASALRHPANECAPYQFRSDGLPIAPCGAIANSLFNDSFSGILVPLNWNLEPGWA